METITLTYSGKSTTYKVAGELYGLPIVYKEETPDEVIRIFERAREKRTRIKICLGDVATGRDWEEDYDVTGYIGLSKGHHACYPILVFNSNSHGGGMLMAECTVKIQESKGKRVLYQHPSYHIEK